MPRKCNLQLLACLVANRSSQDLSKLVNQQQITAPRSSSHLFKTSSRGLALSSALRSDNDNSHQFSKISLSRPADKVAHIQLTTIKAKNAFSLETATEFCRALDLVDEDPSLRCLLLTGDGPDLTSGVDLKSFMGLYARLHEMNDASRKANLLRKMIEKFQQPFKQMYKLSKPVICVQHGLSLGLGMELAACSDIRYCTQDVKMSVREVIMGIAADVGSLQLLPRLVNNQSALRELVYTGRIFGAKEALDLGFVSQIHPTKDEAIKAALQTASSIANNSPVAVQGSKHNLRFSNDNSFLTGLDYNAVWNMGMMQTNDLEEAVKAIFTKDDSANYEDF